MVQLGPVLKLLISPFLTSLDLSYNPLKAQALERLCTVLPLSSLRRLSLAFVTMQKYLVKLLAEVTSVKRPDSTLLLEHLNLEQAHRYTPSLVFDILTVHYSDCVVMKGEKSQECFDCKKYRRVTLRGFSDSVHLVQETYNYEETFKMEPPDSTKTPEPECDDVIGEGRNRVDVWIAPNLLYTATFFSGDDKLSQSDFTVKPRVKKLINPFINNDVLKARFDPNEEGEPIESERPSYCQEMSEVIMAGDRPRTPYQYIDKEDDYLDPTQILRISLHDDFSKSTLSKYLQKLYSVNQKSMYNFELIQDMMTKYQAKFVNVYKSL